MAPPLHVHENCFSSPRECSLRVRPTEGRDGLLSRAAALQPGEWTALLEVARRDNSQRKPSHDAHPLSSPFSASAWLSRVEHMKTVSPHVAAGWVRRYLITSLMSSSLSSDTFVDADQQQECMHQ